MTMISVVVPVYRCASCITELHSQITVALKKITDRFEIILVDDRSPDNDWDVICKQAKMDSTIKAIRLSRNYGQHTAITAGLAVSSGDWVIVMDCDLQDPPEAIVRLYEAAQNGFDIVFARRREKKHSFFKRIGSKIYFKFLSLITTSKFDSTLGTFSILSKKVVSAFLKFNDTDRHYLFILYWLGFNQGYIDYEHTNRYCGKSSYNLKALIKHALSGIFFQTTILLRWIVYLGFLLSSIGLFSAFYLVYRYFYHSTYPGWTSLAVLILIIGGVIISSLGILGLYIGRIFIAVKNRPLYIIDETIN